MYVLLNGWLETAVGRQGPACHVGCHCNTCLALCWEPTSYVPCSAAVVQHHANVDRQFAIWQLANPHTYLKGEVVPGGSFYTPQNITVRCGSGKFCT